MKIDYTQQVESCELFTMFLSLLDITNTCNIQNTQHVGTIWSLCKDTCLRHKCPEDIHVEVFISLEKEFMRCASPFPFLMLISHKNWELIQKYN